VSSKRAHASGLLPRLRPVVQALFLVLFLYLFFNISYPLSERLANNFFFNLDPLIALTMALTGGIAVSWLLMSVVTVVLTVVFGRVFCGWVCPLGTMYDWSAKVVPAQKDQPPLANGPYKNVKYWLLVFLLAGSVAGFSAALFFDPLVFLMRSFAIVIHPALVFIEAAGLTFIRPLATKAGMYTIAMRSVEQPVFHLVWATSAMLAAVIALLYVERRFWCRNLCPLGALLSVLARFAPWGRRVSDTCIDCGKCARSCPMNAIPDGYRDTAVRECIECLTCETVCPTGAVSFGFASPGAQRMEINPSRRGLMLSAVAGLAAAFAAGSSAARKTTERWLIRPPGARQEPDFLDMCLRCGECMKVCPTQALQPARLEAGVEGLFTPVLVPRIGACEEQCNLCGEVCPTGAIRKLLLEEKQYAVIGNAVIDRNRCIAWEQLKVCLICDEVCPYDAIEFGMVTDEKGTLQRPFVIEDKCVGCGQCEQGCPVKGPAAIRVTPINEVRKNEGSYITEKMRRLREVDDSDTEFYEGSDTNRPGDGDRGGQDGGALDEDEPPEGAFSF
jgi:MauM/NapG family ferredoxin protein